MKKASKLARDAARDLAASRKTSATSAGQTEDSTAGDRSRVETINQVFALFRLNFHNQYYSAFPDETQLNQIKKLWLESLSAESPATILKAARRCIEDSEYLPTLHRFLSACNEEKRFITGMPSAHSAYREACLAAHPKSAQQWSHSAVYQAGVEVGWHYLASTAESRAFPVFAEAYQRLAKQVAAGIPVPPPTGEAKTLPAPEKESVETRKRRIRAFREESGFV